VTSRCVRRLRGRIRIRAARTSLGLLTYSRVTVEIDGHEKAACVADTVTLFVE
jgi:hypothetical protein